MLDAQLLMLNKKMEKIEMINTSNRLLTRSPDWDLARGSNVVP